MRNAAFEGVKRGRVDLHLHSYASNTTDYYASNSLAIPESYSDPIKTHGVLKAQGMSLVTLTDHNSIDGVLEMLEAGLPGTFISAEMTATFPEDGCNIHVTVVNMTEDQFGEIDRLRGNVYEMVDYVDAEIARESSRSGANRLAYFMTHPLMSTKNRPYGREGCLQLEHIEKVLLLCNCLEVRNGTRAKSVNWVTARLLRSLTPKTIERLADKHGLQPKGSSPWLKAVVGGSDDHSGINPGRTWTEFVYEGAAPTANDLVDSIRARRTRACGAHGGPVTLAHAIVKLVYDGQFQDGRRAESKSVRIGGALNTLLGFAFGSDSAPATRRLAARLRAAFEARVVNPVVRRRQKDVPFERLLKGEAYGLLGDARFRRELSQTTRTDDKIFLIINTLLNRMFVRYVARIKDAGPNNLVRAIKETVAMVSSHVFVSLPYFLCYSNQSSDRLLVRDVRKAFGLRERGRLVLVTDTFFEVNGVARTIRKMLVEAERRGIDFTVVTCVSEEEREAYCHQPDVAQLIASGRLKIFTSLVNLDVPEYRGLQLRTIPFLEFLKYAQEEGFTKMQVSTPGPVGLAGVCAAKILQIETSATYHTSFPEYVESLTGDVTLEALTWKYMLTFYHTVDEVVVPSEYIAKLLHKRGLRNRKLLVLDRWVDLERFHPRFRNPGIWSRYGVRSKYGVAGEEKTVKFVYVGRVSKEKNLDLLATAFERLCAERSDVHLIIVGDGPYREELAERLAGRPATLTGVLEREELSRALASADVMVFPSTTDTWGNAPLEAQASGLPVVVTDKGGPQELMRDGVTGYRVRGGDVDGLQEAMAELLDPELRRRMGHAAREHVEAHRVDDPFTAILDSRAFRKSARSVKRVDEGSAASASRAEEHEPEEPRLLFTTR